MGRPSQTHLTPGRAAFRHAVDSMVAQPAFRNANWGVLVVDPATGDTLYSHNAGKLFMPASNQKILTGATALNQLGSGFRFRTAFASNARVVNGSLRGDLIVIGRGDPTVSDAAFGDAMIPLRAAAESLWTHGVREIAGALVRGGDAFPDSTLGYGWAWDDLDYGYSAGVDELFFNEGMARVTVHAATTVGGQATARTAPARTVPRIGRVSVITGGMMDPEARQRNRIAWETDVRGPRPLLNLSGFVKMRDSASVTVAIRNPAQAWLDAFAEALAERGIVLRGNVISEPAVDTAGATTLFTLWSPPLRTILPLFEKPSQNQIGEILFRTLGLEKTGVGTPDSGRRVVERQLAAWGADTAGHAVRDGCGLSRHDYVSPETIVRVLDAMRTHTDFRTFYDALPIAGVDGTIGSRMKGTPAEGKVHAKTGTVDKARSLSGYVTTADGRLLLFSFLCNNFTVPNRAVEQVQDAILVRLAGSPLPR
ncbi:MAG: D-alanyl-D-alanine carboxypeptidase/D-alanyl-D-alanine-endopeptidase [Gemmatimonadaceae bacterium]|nr:D-alanyl-D-alanine carboxypeptidase/D-alanyl-D-alanine-endopeptidase [Gemmatimonadaceae bacterium]